MANIRSSGAAATAIVDFDMLEDQRLQTTSYPRVLSGIKLTGSATVGDSLIDMFVGEDYLGRFANTALLEGNIDDIQPLPNVMVYAGEQIHLIVVDAPTTNPLIVNINFARTG